MDVNDNAGHLTPGAVLATIATVRRHDKLAPTGGGVSVSAIEIHFPAQRLARVIRAQVLDEQLDHHRR